MNHDRNKNDELLRNGDEATWCELLTDAYPSSPVPPTLLARLDQVVEAEWDVSPQLVPPRRSWWRTLRAFPAAAALAASIVLAIVLFPTRNAYSWAAMLDAISRAGVLRVEDGDSVRWLSLADGVLGISTSQTALWVDTRRGVMIVRDGESSTIRRKSITGRELANDPNQLLALFLMGSPETGELGYRNLRVAEEVWQTVKREGHESIGLQVALIAENTDGPVKLHLQLDPDSRLPIQYEVRDSQGLAESLRLAYPAASSVVIFQQQFPGVRIAQAAGAESREAPAALNGSPERVNDPSPQSSLASGSNTASALTVDEAQPAHRSETATDPTPWSPGQALSGAPSGWQPVNLDYYTERDSRQDIDRLLADLWQREGVEPVDPAGDEELLRRLFLDLVGRVPTVHEARTYLDDSSPQRYERLVRRLLNSPDHASHLASVWRTFLIPEGIDLTAFGGIEAFDRWLAEQFSAGEPYDAIVRELLLAEGRLSRSGPLLFYSAAKLDPDQLAARTARVFLGMRLECAQCHDHPFEPWTQQDFWGFAAFFAQISRPQGDLESVSTVMRVRDIDRGQVMLPDTDVVVAPKHLGGLGADPIDAEQPPRRQLAQWITASDNPYFARATVNRVWGHMFGKGIVDPVDDFGMQNEPKSPELLDVLASHLIQNDFDLRQVFELVALSRAYRLSSRAESVDEARLDNFAQMHVKSLTAAQLYDCIMVATMRNSQSGNGDYEVMVRFGNSERQQFLQQFGSPTGRATDYSAGIPQALTLMNGRVIDDATGLSSSGLLQSLDAPFFSEQQRVEILYLATLSRRPLPAEWKLLRPYLEDAEEDELRQNLSDILWALLNSAEFTMNH